MISGFSSLTLLLYLFLLQSLFAVHIFFRFRHGSPLCTKQASDVTVTPSGLFILISVLFTKNEEASHRFRAHNKMKVEWKAMAITCITIDCSGGALAFLQSFLELLLPKCV